MAIGVKPNKTSSTELDGLAFAKARAYQAASHMPSNTRAILQARSAPAAGSPAGGSGTHRKSMRRKNTAIRLVPMPRSMMPGGRDGALLTTAITTIAETKDRTAMTESNAASAGDSV